MVDLIVTYLEMTVPPTQQMLPCPVSGVCIRKEGLDQDTYLGLYRTIGAPLQWDQRLRMTEGDLRELLEGSTTHLYILTLGGQRAGMCEFEGVGRTDVELTNFGLIAEAQGRKLGPYLLDRALRSVWSHKPQRVWLHTDTNDHIKAIPTYQRAGFRIYQRRLETFPD